MTNFNERTITLLYKRYISPDFILERDDVGRVREMDWRRGQTVILTQQYFFLILAGLLRAQSPLSAAGSQFSILSPTGTNCNWNQAVCVLVIFLFDIHLLPLLLRLFTQVHLLIDCSVEGQYVTRVGKLN